MDYLTQEQMLEMARIAGLRIPDEDVEHLTIRLNALLEASAVLDQYPLGELKALPSLPHPFELPSRQGEERPAPSLTVETDAPIAYKPITELAHLIRTKQLSPVELTNMYLERIGQFDGDLKSYITVLPEIARREAQEAEQALMDGADLGPVHGIPLAYKDEFYTKGVRAWGRAPESCHLGLVYCPDLSPPSPTLFADSVIGRNRSNHRR